MIRTKRLAVRNADAALPKGQTSGSCENSSINCRFARASLISLVSPRICRAYVYSRSGIAKGKQWRHGTRNRFRRSGKRMDALQTEG